MSDIADFLASIDRPRKVFEAFTAGDVVRQHLGLAQRLADQYAGMAAQYKPLSAIITAAIPDAYKSIGTSMSISGIASAAIPDAYKSLDTSKSIASLAQLLAPNIDTSQFTAATRAIESMVRPWSRLPDLTSAFRAFEDQFSEARRFGPVLSAWVDQHLRRLRIEKRFARFGWVGLSRLFDDDELVALGECLSKHGRATAEARIIRRMRRGGHAAVRRAASRWRHLPTLHRRRKVVLAALRAHREGDYVLSIPAIWPLVDAVAADCEGLVRPRGTGHVKKALRHAADASALETAVDVLFRTNTKNRPLSTSNRHDVLHGRAINYGTEANSCRVILLLDVYAEFAMVAPKTTVKTRSTP